jgi:hypothetical protein
MTLKRQTMGASARAGRYAGNALLDCADTSYELPDDVLSLGGYLVFELVSVGLQLNRPLHPVGDLRLGV